MVSDKMDLPTLAIVTLDEILWNNDENKRYTYHTNTFNTFIENPKTLTSVYNRTKTQDRDSITRSIKVNKTRQSITQEFKTNPTKYEPNTKTLAQWPRSHEDSEPAWSISGNTKEGIVQIVRSAFTNGCTVCFFYSMNFLLNIKKQKPRRELELKLSSCFFLESVGHFFSDNFTNLWFSRHSVSLIHALYWYKSMEITRQSLSFSLFFSSKELHLDTQHSTGHQYRCPHPYLHLRVFSCFCLNLYSWLYMMSKERTSLT